MNDCWVNTISREHVLAGVKGGFTQAGHGSDRTLKRLGRGDNLVIYSPRARIDSGDPVQAFTALGRVLDDVCFREEVTPDYHPWRRRIEFESVAVEAPIRPLLERLSFITDTAHWGFPFRRELFRIPATDFKLIVEAMTAREIVSRERGA